MFDKFMVSVLQRKRYIECAFWIVLFLVLIFKYVVAVPDEANFIGSYKYIVSDGYDWYANGKLFLQSTETSIRNPGLPFLIKLLTLAGLPSLIILFNQLILFGIYVLIYVLTFSITKRKLLSYALVLTAFVNYDIQIFSMYILADYYAIMFILLAYFLLFKKKEELSLVSLGVSVLFQNFAFFLFPLFIIYLNFESIKGTFVNFKIKNLYSIAARNLGYLLLFLHLNILWFIYKSIVFGDPLYTGVTQFGLITLNFDSLYFYSVNSVILFGLLPALLIGLIIVGVAKGKVLKDKNLAPLLAGALITFLFWILAYDWNDKRFLLYFLPYIYPLAGAIFVKTFKVKQIYFILALFLVSIPTFWVKSGFFNYNHLPLLPGTGLNFGLVVKNHKADLDTSVSLSRGDTHLLADNFAGELFLNREYNHQDSNTIYSDYRLFLHNELDDDGTVCESMLGGKNLYILNSVSFIEYSRPLDEYISECQL